MATVQIKEGDQLILACDLSEIANQNGFIQALVAEAQSTTDGIAEREDCEGCLVTALIFSNDEEDSAIVSSDAYNTGFEAATQGEPRTANPYARGTWDSNAWFAGWDAQ